MFVLQVIINFYITAKPQSLPYNSTSCCQCLNIKKTEECRSPPSVSDDMWMRCVRSVHMRAVEIRRDHMLVTLSRRHQSRVDYGLYGDKPQTMRHQQPVQSWAVSKIEFFPLSLSTYHKCAQKPFGWCFQ